MNPERVVFFVNSQALRRWLEPALAAKGIPCIWRIMNHMRAARAGEPADAWLRQPVVTVPLALQSLPRVCDFFRERAPRADIRIFFAPGAPWLDAEARCATILTVGHSRHLQALLAETLHSDSINGCLDRLYTDFGRERVSVFKGWEESCAPAALLHAFFTETGLGSAEEAAALASSLVYPSAPRLDVLRFMEAINFLFTDAVTPHVFTWREQRAFLQGGTGAEHILSPTQRAQLLQRLLAAERKAPQHLEIIPFLEQELHKVEGEQDTLERCDDLRPENARRLAELLDPDFARWILNAPHKPEESRRFVSRVCLEAIRQVHGKGSAKPQAASRPKVSVLTLTYNHGKYIEETIKSVLMQETDFEVEHIILDNGSSDETAAIIQEYASTCKSIRPIIIPGPQEPHAVLWLFEAARTPYVAICEGDDYFTNPKKLQTQVDFLDDHPDCGLCFHPVRVVYEDDPSRERVHPRPEDLPHGLRQFYSLNDLIKGNIIQTNSVMYRWAFCHGLPVWFRYDLIPGDWYWHLLHAETGPIGFINTVMSVYRRHKEALYYLAEVDRLKHRYTVGLRELDFYDAVNEHFRHRFESIILDMTNGVFVDCALYCEQINDHSLLQEMADKYPRFTGHFLDSLDALDR
ncbi:hypothetical protein KL86DPRO_20210 [uncultured delta proteobacterium]|uniref:Glycosyltransferase 2-like domain-containing protein n=1 Tax=uncultured delta proteobacterium TaxID=34034 RepID=A0A212JWP7_9DELT|nr:hypothetical protein KL86DPRO_20210 [uncultured delta proteobacterium]